MLTPRPNGNVTPRRKTTRPRGYIENYKPQKKTVALLSDTKSVLDEYHDHWPLTVRQIYYRLIGAYDYPKTEAFYGKLCHHLANARRGACIEFVAIRDDNVSSVAMQHFDNEEDFRAHVRHQAQGYQRNKLAGQPYHIEVWCEAAGMVFQLDKVARRYSIKVYSSSGFDSLTAKKDIADRICEIDKPAIILHLGDYDPSGVSIFESSAEDVAAFVEADSWGHDTTVEFKRVALTRAQVEEYDLPTAPAKASDTRSKYWSGGTCQLEALPPDTIAALLRHEIEALIDFDQYRRDRGEEEIERIKLTRLLPPPEDAA